MSAETATKRIPVTPTAFDTFRDFCRGLDMNYSDCVEFIFKQLVKDDETPIEAGIRLQKQLKQN